MGRVVWALCLGRTGTEVVTKLVARPLRLVGANVACSGNGCGAGTKFTRRVVTNPLPRPTASPSQTAARTASGGSLGIYKWDQSMTPCQLPLASGLVTKI